MTDGLMKSDRLAPPANDEPEAFGRAHLADPDHRGAVEVVRRDPPEDLADRVRGFWFPSWRVPAGAEYPQRVLRYPVCLLVVTPSYARFHGPATGLSTTVLTGTGSAAGVLLAPATGALLLGGSVAPWTDRHTEIAEVFGARGARVVDRVRATLGSPPVPETARAAAADAFADFLRSYPPLDADGELINAIVEFVEGRAEVTRVSQICAHFSMTERTLQRLVRRRLGLSPKWLIQRRRLHDAAERLRGGHTTLADLAADLAYADQAHLVRDFRTVTGATPAAFGARYRQD